MTDDIERNCPWCGEDTLERDGVDEVCTAETCEYLVEGKFSEPGPDYPMFAWRIRDHVEERDWLSLSANEAGHYETIESATVTIVGWSSRPATAALRALVEVLDEETAEQVRTQTADWCEECDEGARRDPLFDLPTFSGGEPTDVSKNVDEHIAKSHETDDE